jgi:tetratricopeptide (TPR) repeat protein
MTVRSSVVLLLSLGLSLAPLRVSAQAAAPADDKAANMKRAEELFRNGERLYTEGSYEPAILAFQESYELSKEPSLLYNIGNSYERLGDFANARRYLDQYRAFASEKEREPLARRIQALDQRQREKEDRERKAAADAQKEPPKDPQPAVTTPTEPKPDEKPKKDRFYGPGAIALTAGVVVGLGLGVGFGAKASGEKNKALDGCSSTGGTLFCSDAASDSLDKRKTSALIADIGFAVAGVAAIGLITVLVLKAKKGKTEQRAQLVPTFGPRGGGASFQLRF